MRLRPVPKNPWILPGLGDKCLIYYKTMISRESTSCKTSLSGKSRTRIYDIQWQLSIFSSNRWYDPPNEINRMDWWLKIGSRRTWWTGGAALVAVFLPHSFEAQETSERPYLFEHNIRNVRTFLATTVHIFCYNNTLKIQWKKPNNCYLPTVSLSYLIVYCRQPVDDYSKIRPLCRIFTPALLNQPE
jgi:hypothetical protein